MHGADLPQCRLRGTALLQIGAQHSQVHLQCAQSLAEVIVQLACNAPLLLFTRGQHTVGQLLQFLPRLTQSLFGSDTLGDIAQHHRVQLAGAVDRLRDRSLDGKFGAIAAQRIEGTLSPHLSFGNASDTETTDVFLMCIAVPRRNEIAKGTADGIARVATKQRFGHRVEQDNTLIAVDGNNGFHRRSNDAGEPLFALPDARQICGGYVPQSAKSHPVNRQHCPCQQTKDGNKRHDDS